MEGKILHISSSCLPLFGSRYSKSTPDSIFDVTRLEDHVSIRTKFAQLLQVEETVVVSCNWRWCGDTAILTHVARVGFCPTYPSYSGAASQRNVIFLDVYNPLWSVTEHSCNAIPT